jgi:hypothetical protein
VNPSEYECGAWIKATLTSAGVVGPDALATDAYLDVVPSEAELPAVRFSVEQRKDTRTNGQHIAVSVIRFLVVGLSDGHAVASASELADAIDSALHRASGQHGSTRILACTRVEPFASTPHENGHTYRLGGGTYEIVAQVA